MIGSRVAGELRVLAGCFTAGLAAGMLYDLTRLLRLPFPVSRLRDAFFDALYYAAAGALFALALYELNGGSPRLYALAGFGLGAVAYIKTVSAALDDAAALFSQRRRAHRAKRAREQAQNGAHAK